MTYAAFAARAGRTPLPRPFVGSWCDLSIRGRVVLFLRQTYLTRMRGFEATYRNQKHGMRRAGLLTCSCHWKRARIVDFPRRQFGTVLASSDTEQGRELSVRRP